VNITGISANNQVTPPTGPAASLRLADEPAPMLNPSAMKISNEETFNPARMLPTHRPGPTPRK
jgi:hypothetical protein